MRPLRKELTGDEHSEARRNSQLASLAEGALLPIVEMFEEAIRHKLIGIARCRSPVEPHVVWATIGELSAFESLREHIRSAKAGMTKLEK